MPIDPESYRVQLDSAIDELIEQSKSIALQIKGRNPNSSAKQLDEMFATEKTKILRQQHSQYSKLDK